MVPHSKPLNPFESKVFWSTLWTKHVDFWAMAWHGFPSRWMKLLVEFCERSSCYAALHSSDASEIFKATGLTQTRHFCRALRLQCTGRDDAFVGWIGDQCLSPGLMAAFDAGLVWTAWEQDQIIKSSNPMSDHYVPSFSIIFHIKLQWLSQLFGQACFLCYFPYPYFPSSQTLAKPTNIDPEEWCRWPNPSQNAWA